MGYRQRWRTWRGSGSKWSNRYARGKGYYARAKRSRYGRAGIASMPYILGGLIGMTDLDKNIPAEIKLLAAIMPSGVTKAIPKGGMIKAVAQGMLLGDVIQARTGINLMNLGSGSTSGGSGSF